MRVLVTGPDGFVGRHLCRALRDAGHTLVEAIAPHLPGGLELKARESVRALVQSAGADAIVHLAAMSSVAASHKDPEEAFAVNALGTTHLLGAVKAVTPKARVLMIGSGEVYGNAHETPTEEDAPIAPLSPYAASKAAAELVALQFHRTYGTDVVCVRPFSHLGRGQAPQFVVPSFAAQISAIRRGSAEPVLKTGDLSPVRDFLHVDDVVAAYVLLLGAAQGGSVYNVASGTGRTVKSLLEEMLGLAGVTARIETDPERVRPVEIPRLIGSSARLRALGWVPRLTVTRALQDVLEEQGATS